MQVYRHLPQQPPNPLALAIGNFDGMHVGHQTLLINLAAMAKANNLTPAVMTFEPHPREFFTPLQAPARLSNLREKLEYFQHAKVQKVFVCAFNKHFASISADDFMHTILRKKLNANTILVGEDFKFGVNRSGDIHLLKATNFNLISLPRIDFEHSRVSSTRVRDALAAGDLNQASLLLGRAYSISGKVVHGAKRGRQLGFPTANVHIKHERPALTGVYAVKLDGLNAVANLGVRPTIGGVEKLLLEVHVLDFNGDLYHKHVHVAFLHKIRTEMKFENLDALKAQIAADIVVAKQFFGKVK